VDRDGFAIFARIARHSKLLTCLETTEVFVKELDRENSVPNGFVAADGSALAPERGWHLSGGRLWEWLD
jgi:hypothetical protein